MDNALSEGRFVMDNRLGLSNLEFHTDEIRLVVDLTQYRLQKPHLRHGTTRPSGGVIDANIGMPRS
jgi:hypothetical protein